MMFLFFIACAFADTSCSYVDESKTLKITGSGEFTACPNDVPVNFDNIKVLEIGNEVTGLPANFCQNCKKLQSLTLGTGLTELGDQFFQGASNTAEVNEIKFVIPKNAEFATVIGAIKSIK